MSKPLLIYQAPVATRSGYGDHARDILKSIFDYDKFDIITVPTRWGNTPQNQINPTTDFGKQLLSTVGKQVTKQPEVHIQMTVPNEFQKKGKFSIGITAGIESTLAPKDWIDGCNRMMKKTKELANLSEHLRLRHQSKFYMKVLNYRHSSNLKLKLMF